MPTNTRRPPVTKTSVARYVKNVGKSLALASVDVISDNAPAMKIFLQESDEYIKKGFAYIKNPRAATDRAERQTLVSKVYQAVGSGLNKFKNDVLTGDMYNDSKAQAHMLDEFNKEMGFDDMSESDDFNWNDGDRSASGTSAVSDSYSVAIGAAAQTHATAVAQGTELVIGANKASTKLLVANMDKLGVNISAGLASVYSNISITNKSIQTHVENSNKFYEATNDLFREQVALMRELVDMQRSLYAPNKYNRYGNRGTALSSSMDGYGNIKLDGYLKNIKKNIENNLGLMGLFDNDAGSPINMLLTAIMDPTKMITKAFMNKMLPKAFKSNIASMDKALASMFSQLIAALNRKKFEGNTLGSIASIFGINLDNKTTINPKEYFKNAIPFDGITKQAIIETIPGYLSRIEAALTGMNERYYDYEEGRWTKFDAILDRFEHEKKTNIASANRGIRDDLSNTMRDLRSKDPRNAESIQKSIDYMMNKIYSDNGYFRIDKVGSEPAWSYYGFKSKKIFDEVIVKNLSKSTIRDLARKNMMAKEDFSRRMRGKEGAHAIERQIFNNSQDYDFTSSKSRSMIKGTGLLSLSYDEEGKNVFYYLREILGRMGNRPKNKNNNSRTRHSRNRSKRQSTTTNTTSSDSSDSDGDGDGDPESEGYIDDSIWEELDKKRAKELEESNKVKEFFDKLSGVFDKSPVGRMFTTIGKGLADVFSSPINYMTKMLEKADESLFKVFFGENEEFVDEHGKKIGVWQKMLNEMKSSFNNITEKIAKALKFDKFEEFLKSKVEPYVKPVWNEIKSTAGRGFNRAKTAVGNTFGKAFKSASAKFTNIANKVSNGGVVTADEVENIDNREMVQDNDEFYDNIVESAYGRVVTKRGLTMISPGEVIIPATSDRKKQNKMLAGERKDRSRIVRAFKSMSGKIGLNAKGTVDLNKLKDSLYKIYNENKAGASKVAAGGVLGLGAGLLTGINPLLGAVAGAGISILDNSQTLQRIVFGEDTEDGHIGGIIPKKIQDYFKKAGGDAIDFGVAGGILGLVTGMGPLAGAAVGAGVGLLKNSETVNNFLFGEDGVIGPENKEKISKFIKKSAPNALVGAGIGILTGPFGLLGNAALGAGLGMITSTNTFHELMFGKEDDPDDNGIFGAFKEGMLNPAIKKVHEIIDDFKEYAKKNIFDNLKKFLDPFSQMIKNGINNITNGVKDHLADMFERSIGIPAADFMRERVFKPLTKVIGGIVKVPLNVGKAAFALPFKAIGNLGTHIKTRQIQKGTAYNMTAEERLQWRKDNNIKLPFGRDKMREQDEIIAGMDIEDLQNLASLTGNQLNSRKELGENLGEARQASSKTISSYFNKNTGKDGRSLYEIVGVNKITKLTKLAANGDAAAFDAALRKLVDKGELSTDQMNELNKLIASRITTVKTSMDAISSFDMDKDEKNKILSDLLGGRKISGRKDIRQIMMTAEAELANRIKKKGESYDPDEEAEKKEELALQKIEDDRNLTKIYRENMENKSDAALQHLSLISQGVQLIANPGSTPVIVDNPISFKTKASGAIELPGNTSSSGVEGKVLALPSGKGDDDSIEAKNAETKDQQDDEARDKTADSTEKTASLMSRLVGFFMGDKAEKKKKKNKDGFFSTALGGIYEFLGAKGSTIAKIGLGAVGLGAGFSLLGVATDWFKNKVWPTLKTAMFGKTNDDGKYSGGLLSGLANKFNDIIHGDGTPQNPGLVAKLINGGKSLLFGDNGSWDNPTGGLLGWLKSGKLYEFIGSKVVPNLIGGFGLAMNHIVTPLVALLIKNFPSMVGSLGKALLNGIKAAVFPSAKISRDGYTVTSDNSEFKKLEDSTAAAIKTNVGLDSNISKIYSSNTASSVYGAASSSIDINSLTDSNFIAAEDTYDKDGNHLNKTSTDLMYKNAGGLSGLLGAKESTNTVVYDENGNIALRSYDRMNTVDSAGSKILDATGRSFTYGLLGRNKNKLLNKMANVSTKGGKGIFGVGKKIFGTGVKATGKAAGAAHGAGASINAMLNRATDIRNYADTVVSASGLTGSAAKELKDQIVSQVSIRGVDGINDVIMNLDTSSLTDEAAEIIGTSTSNLTEALMGSNPNVRSKISSKIDDIAKATKNKFTNNKIVSSITNAKNKFSNSKIGNILGNRSKTTNEFINAAVEAQGLTGKKANKAAKKMAKSIKWNGAAGIDDILEGIDGAKLSAEANESLLNKAIDATDSVVKAPTISSKAKSKLTDIGKKITDSKAGQKVTTAVGKAKDAVKNNSVVKKVTGAVDDAKGLIGKITSKLKNFFAELAENSTILGFFKKAAKSDVSEGIIKKTIKELGEKVASSALGKVASKALTKIASAAAKFVPFLNIAMYVADFIWGYNNADTLLGIAKGDEYQIGIGQKCICGLVHTLNNAFLLGLVPTDVIIDIFVDVLFPIFGLDVTSLKEARDRADNILDEWNKEHPEETYTNLEDFNNKDKWTTKAKKAISSGLDKVKTGVSNAWNSAVDKVKTGASNAWNATKEWAGNTWNSVKTGASNLIENAKNSKIGQTVSGAIDYVKSGIQSVTADIKENGFSAITEGIKGGYSDSSKVIKDVRAGKYTVFDKKYWKSESDDNKKNKDNENPLSTLGTIFSTVNKVLNIPNAMMGYVGSKIRETFTNYIKAVREGTLDATSDINAVKAGKYTIFSKQYWGSDSKSTDNPLAILGDVFGTVIRVMNAPSAMMGWVGTKVKNAFLDMIDCGDIGKETDNIILEAKAGNISVFDKKYWTITADDSNPLSGIGKAVGFIQRLFNAPIVLIQSAFNKISSGFVDAWEWFTGLFGGGNSNSGGSRSAGSGRNKTNGNGEHLYQSNSAIANVKYGNSTIGDSGCAPVAATNLINNMGTSGSNLADAVRFAERGNYIGREGTDISYFNSYLASKGISTTNTSNKKTALDAIRSGRQVILLGQDSHNSKKAPYGTNPHFVTATGVAPNGDIIVEDPDLPDNRVYYKPNTLMKSMISSVITGDAGRKINRRASSIGGKSKAKRGMRRVLYGRGTKLGAQAVLNVARSQIGVKEHQPNVVKYNNAYWTEHNLGTSKTYNNSQDYYQWCCVFVWWVFNQAGASSLFMNGGKAVACSDCAKYYKQKGKYNKSNPKPGDIVMFDWDNCGIEQHTGIVESVKGDKIYTIEGNTGDRVARKTRNIKNVIGFCHIDYPYEYDDTTVVDMSKYGDTSDYKHIATNGGPMTGDKYSAFVGGSADDTEYVSGIYDGTTSSSTDGTIFTKIGNLANSVFKAMYGEDTYQMMFGKTDTSNELNQIYEDETVGSGPALIGNTVSEKIWNYLRNHGYTAAGAAGLMGNLHAESSLRPNNLQNSYEVKLGHTDDSYTDAVNKKTYSKDSFINDKAGYGLAQWTHHSLKRNLYRDTVEQGISIGDLGGQLYSLTNELDKNFPAIANILKTTADYNVASDTVLRDFENPKVKNWDDRRKFSKEWYDKYKTATINPNMNYTTSVLDSEGNTVEYSVPSGIVSGNPSDYSTYRAYLDATRSNTFEARGRAGNKRTVGDARILSRSGGYRHTGGATKALNANSAYADGVTRTVNIAHANGSSSMNNTGVDYETFLQTIITVLLQISDNTTLLNAILEILSKNFNLDIDKSQIAKSANSRVRAQEALNQAIKNSGGAANMTNMLNNRDTQYVLDALKAIARE